MEVKKYENIINPSKKKKNITKSLTKNYLKKDISIIYWWKKIFEKWRRIIIWIRVYYQLINLIGNCENKFIYSFKNNYSKIILKEIVPFIYII